MNWEKTVMSDEQAIEAIRKVFGNISVGVTHEDQAEREAQAEISYKAGEVAGYKRGLEMREPYLEGIRKVVEMIERFDVEDEMKDDDFEEWENLKKENGL